MEPETTGDKWRNPDGTLKAGHPPMGGRPKGSISIIGKLKQMWEEDPDDFIAYVKEVRKDKMMRREIVQQIDGKPVQPIANADGTPFVVQVVQYAGNNNSTPVQSETLPT